MASQVEELDPVIEQLKDQLAKVTRKLESSKPFLIDKRAPLLDEQKQLSNRLTQLSKEITDLDAKIEKAKDEVDPLQIGLKIRLETALSALLGEELQTTTEEIIREEEAAPEPAEPVEEEKPRYQQQRVIEARGKVLTAVQNAGSNGIGFTRLEQQTGLSHTTVARYLQILVEEEEIVKSDSQLRPVYTSKDNFVPREEEEPAEREEEEESEPTTTQRTTIRDDLQFPLDATKLWRVFKIEQGHKDYIIQKFPADLTAEEFMTLSLPERVVYYKIHKNQGSGKAPGNAQNKISDEEIRDAFVTLSKMWENFSITELAMYLGRSPSAFQEHIDAWIKKGTIKVAVPRKGPQPARYTLDTEFEGYEAPKRAPRGEPATPVLPKEKQTRGKAVAGTGKHHPDQFRGTHPEVQALISAARRAGAEVRMTQGGHIEVKCPLKRVLISGTPSSSTSVLNDRTRLRRAGLDV